MVPLRIVENPFFNNIFEDLNISSKGLKMISRRSLTRKMEDLYIDNVQCLKDTLNNVKYVCTTADIWSGRRRSFLGVTVHWIREDMGRESAALACRRFRSSHTAERIVELINDIHDDFGLYHTKIRATVTDNGSNFLKAFREYGVNGKSMEAEEIVEDLSFGDSQSDNESEEDRLSEISDSSVVCKTSITKALSIILPNHIKCCSHTLNLCASVDILKAISTCEKLSAMHNRVISKCNILWRAASRPKSSEILHDILGYTLTRPGQTRWNSLYDALKKILSIKDKCSQVFHALKIKNMITEAEFDYIEEHLDCAKPVAEALNILQGEKYMYYGATVSILFALLPKLESLNQRQWKFCKPLSECFLNSVRHRFRDIYNFLTPESLNAAIATVSHPEFKTRWLTRVSTENQNKIMRLFKEAVAAESAFESASGNNGQERSNLPEATCDFFDFDEETTTNEPAIDLQVLQFLNDNCRMLQMLNKYQDIKKVFIKYNTPLPSSAAVERLFSYATMTNLPKSNKLSDKNFEIRVLMKANSHLFT